MPIFFSRFLHSFTSLQQTHRCWVLSMHEVCYSLLLYTQNNFKYKPHVVLKVSYNIIWSYFFLLYVVYFRQTDTSL